MKLLEVSNAASKVDTAWNVTITSVGDETFLWVITDFPVLTIHFRKVKFEAQGKERVGLVHKDKVLVTGHFSCTKHCTVSINQEEYPVLWELEARKEPKNPGAKKHGINRAAQTPLVAAETNMTHTLPFKVLGSCYCKERQIVLERALEFMDHNRLVLADQVCDTQNKQDPNAIAVQIMTDDEFDTVGYIARELTQYVHPCMGTPGFHVSVKNIRFRTNFLRIGFYLTINITKQGIWDDVIVQASKNVR